MTNHLLEKLYGVAFQVEWIATVMPNKKNMTSIKHMVYLTPT